MLIIKLCCDCVYCPTAMSNHLAAMAAQLLLTLTGLLVGVAVVGVERTVLGPRQSHMGFATRTVDVVDGGPAGRVLFAGAARGTDVRTTGVTGLDADDLQVCFSWLSSMAETCFHVVQRADMSLRSSCKLAPSSCR